MAFWKLYFKRYKKMTVVFLLFCAIFFIVFGLYHLPVGAVLYPMFLCLLIGGVILFADFRKAYQRHQKLLELSFCGAELIENFPECQNWEDRDYQKIIQSIQQELKNIKDAMGLHYLDMVDYYTVWVHQVKTPIAALQLYLQDEDSQRARRMKEEVFRIEQYVGMVLAFLRLDSESTDYVFCKCSIDDIVKESVKKFVGQFIRKGLKLSYKPLNFFVVTDEKWLSLCIEQVLSNAVKYTREGGITIAVKEPSTLVIQDTGIGIAAEDLPRIFEKGYTGYHGREDKKASGIGLYLCRRICENLGHKITVESEPGKGTTVKIVFLQKERKYE